MTLNKIGPQGESGDGEEEVEVNKRQRQQTNKRDGKGFYNHREAEDKVRTKMCKKDPLAGRSTKLTSEILSLRI